MALELDSLRTAIGSLGEVLACSQDPQQMAGLGDGLRKAVRSGVIQHFEFTYELCWKFMQRWLALNRFGEEALLPRSRKDLFRMAARQGLITHPERWFDFAEARNITSHTYDENRADSVYLQAIIFLDYAKELLVNLEASND